MPESAIDAVVARFDPAHQNRVRQLIGTDEELADYWGVIIPQPHLEMLPKKLTRKCCTYKTCGNTELVLSESFASLPVEAARRGQVAGPLSLQYMRFAYRRVSNDDVFFSGSFTQALEFVNDPWSFPIDEDTDEVRRAEIRP
ncbi:hypothetical protein [Pseudoclavibacter sp. VKM Ac-2888]|uniref:hypothetical protein n=1 Tax=Pseudoclavibacter sp. VKM Ac-2888 TaxID=2783830 RepID=UPI00188B26FC|nr:hypothetical protein [Pseudoclavibacter sp. VKM Ac-2888]MBF4549312.1 hypothetical protein [Pseudoclavibacter sp. VKM Ac-2888]